MSSENILSRVHETPEARRLRIELAMAELSDQALPLSGEPLIHAKHRERFAERAAGVGVLDEEVLTPTKDDRHNGNFFRGHKRLTAGLATLLAAGVASGAVAAIRGDSSSKTNKETPVVTRLESLVTDGQHPNILSVEPDEVHPGLVKVSVIIMPGHTTYSDLIYQISPAQAKDISGTSDVIASYRGAYGYVNHYGDKFSFDVNAKTGEIVQNPNTKPGAQP